MNLKSHYNCILLAIKNKNKNHALLFNEFILISVNLHESEAMKLYNSSEF